MAAIINWLHDSSASSACGAFTQTIEPHDGSDIISIGCTLAVLSSARGTFAQINRLHVAVMSVGV